LGVAPGVETAKLDAQSVERDDKRDLQQDDHLPQQSLSRQCGCPCLTINALQRKGKFRAIGRDRVAATALF